MKDKPQHKEEAVTISLNSRPDRLYYADAVAVVTERDQGHWVFAQHSFGGDVATGALIVAFGPDAFRRTRDAGRSITDLLKQVQSTRYPSWEGSVASIPDVVALHPSVVGRLRANAVKFIVSSDDAIVDIFATRMKAGDDKKAIEVMPLVTVWMAPPTLLDLISLMEAQP